MDETFVSSLLSDHATPLYLFDGTVLEQRVAYLRSKLPQRVGLCYAIKANPFLAGYLSPLVERLELCSPGEYRICERQGLPKSQFVVSGVYKTPDFIQDILPYSPAIFTVESMEQFHLLRTRGEEGRTAVRPDHLAWMSGESDYGRGQAPRGSGLAQVVYKETVSAVYPVKKAYGGGARLNL